MMKSITFATNFFSKYINIHQFAKKYILYSIIDNLRTTYIVYNTNNTLDLLVHIYITQLY